jgi:hypothetical protein
MCLQNDKDIPIDLKKRTHDFKLVAHQKFVVAQLSHVVCLRDGHGALHDLAFAVHYLKLTKDQTHPSAQKAYIALLCDSRGILSNFEDFDKVERDFRDISMGGQSEMRR